MSSDKPEEIPFITKENVRNNFEGIATTPTSTNDRSQDSFSCGFVVHNSGSTGKPMRFLYGENALAAVEANFVRLSNHGGKNRIGLRRIYDGLPFSKKAITKTLMATQQYFVVNALCLDNKLTVDVITPNGIEKLFREGQSQIVFSPIVDVDQWKGIPVCDEAVASLYVDDLNNFISCLCFDTCKYAITRNVKRIAVCQNLFTNSFLFFPGSIKLGPGVGCQF